MSSDLPAAPSVRPLGEKAAPLLRVLGAIVLLSGVLHLYADRVLFDADAFASRAAL